MVMTRSAQRSLSKHAIAGGFLGTLLMTAVMYLVAPLLLGQPMDIAGMLGRFFAVGWALGMLIHFVNGTLIFPLLFSQALYGVLPGSPVVKGLTFGAGLWLAAEIIAMPMLGAGVFHAGAGGLLAALGSLAGHLLYGGVLGAVAGRAMTLEEPARTPPSRGSAVAGRH